MTVEPVHPCTQKDNIVSVRPVWRAEIFLSISHSSCYNFLDNLCISAEQNTYMLSFVESRIQGCLGLPFIGRPSLNCLSSDCFHFCKGKTVSSASYSGNSRSYFLLASITRQDFYNFPAKLWTTKWINHRIRCRAYQPKELGEQLKNQDLFMVFA